jgi:hypothetical protein
LLRFLLAAGFYLFLAGLLFVTHYGFLDLPFFWDEMGHFIPAALDLWRDGEWIPKSVTPNVHPPGVMAWLTVCWSVAGFSVESTRAAMLLLAGALILVTFLLALELSRGSPSALPLLPPALLVASPLFFTQSMMAQLDMPAALFGTLALYLFLRRRYWDSAAVCTVLVMVKETGLVVPLVMGAWLAWQREFRRAAFFLLPPAALALWLIALRTATGHWFGSEAFAEYNVYYTLHPVRIALALFRRLYYLLFAEFRWIAVLLVIAAWRRGAPFRGYPWNLIAMLAAAYVLMFSLAGGAHLERYLLPVLPLLYLATGVAVAALPVRAGRAAVLALGVGLTAGLLWNPPWPFPHENNLSMVKLAWLHRDTARYMDRLYPNAVVATAWPLSAGLRDPDFGYVERPRNVVAIPDFRRSNLQALDSETFDILVLYSRDWDPEENWIRLPFVESLMRRYYGYEPQVAAAELMQRYGLYRVRREELGGYWVEILARRNFTGK